MNEQLITFLKDCILADEKRIIKYRASGDTHFADMFETSKRSYENALWAAQNIGVYNG